MPLIHKREWQMPNGDRWETWIVYWMDGQKRQQRQLFPTFEEAEAFFVELAKDLRRRKRREHHYA